MQGYRNSTKKPWLKYYIDKNKIHACGLNDVFGLDICLNVSLFIEVCEQRQCLMFLQDEISQVMRFEATRVERKTLYH